MYNSVKYQEQVRVINLNDLQIEGFRKEKIHFRETNLLKKITLHGRYIDGIRSSIISKIEKQPQQISTNFVGSPKTQS